MAVTGAMRAARNEAARAANKTAAPRPKAQPASAKEAPVAPEASGEQLCGHKALSGRTCTREQGHAAKSHRYA